MTGYETSSTEQDQAMTLTSTYVQVAAQKPALLRLGFLHFCLCCLSAGIANISKTQTKCLIKSAASAASPGWQSSQSRP